MKPTIMKGWPSQAYAAHDEGTLFEKTSGQRPKVVKAVAGGAAYLARNLKGCGLIFALAGLNGGFCRCGAAPDF